MSDDNNPAWGLLGIGMLVGSYFLGKHKGHKKAANEYLHEEKDKEIQRLRRELQEAKQIENKN